MKKGNALLSVLLFIGLLVLSAFAAGENKFKAELSGSEVVPPVKTMAKGETIFELNKSGDELKYKLTVTDIANVTAVHIHDGKVGKNGPPIVSLYAGPKKEGKFSGTLSEGTITAKDLIGQLKGKLFSHFIQMIEDGHAYVNVHTDKYPDGEIRGQIKP